MCRHVRRYTEGTEGIKIYKYFTCTFYNFTACIYFMITSFQGMHIMHIHGFSYLRYCTSRGTSAHSLLTLLLLHNAF